MTDPTALMRAIDECGDRLEAAATVREKAQAVEHDIEIEHATLMRALALTQEPAQAAPAQETKPKGNDNLALAACISAIRNHFADSVANQMTDRATGAALKAHGYKFRLPTVRNALAEIGKETRAAAETAHDDSHVNRSNAREASSMSAPHSGGAGDPLEMPGFLKRDKQAAE